MTTGDTGTRVRPTNSSTDFIIEDEVEFGRYWRALAARWWLPVLGIVLGALIGFATTSQAKPYRADVVVYLGQPLYPNGGQPIQTVSTNFTFVNQLLTSHSVVQRIARSVGVPSKKLDNAIQLAPFSPEGPGKAGEAARIVTISVFGFAPRLGVAAATDLAHTVLSNTDSYVNTKLSVYQARLARTVRELNLVQSREDRATAQQSALVNDHSLGAAEKLLLLAHYDNIFNANESRRVTLESQQLALRDQVALARQIELPRILEPAISQREFAPSPRAHIAVGIVVGLIAGIIAALLWEPVARRVRSRPAV